MVLKFTFGTYNKCLAFINCYRHKYLDPNHVTTFGYGLLVFGDFFFFMLNKFKKYYKNYISFKENK